MLKMTEFELKAMYGDHVRISNVGRYKLVHLDNPTTDVMEKRAHDFDPKTFFHPDCEVCHLADEMGLVIFNEETTT